MSVNMDSITEERSNSVSFFCADKFLNNNRTDYRRG